MKSRLHTLVLLAALLACRQPVSPPPTDSDAGDACPDACSQLAALGCPEAKGDCVAVCRRAGPLLSPACVARAQGQSDLAACHVRCAQ